MLAGNLGALMIAPNLERKNSHVAVSLSDTETVRNQLNETDSFFPFQKSNKTLPNYIIDISIVLPNVAAENRPNCPNYNDYLVFKITNANY